MALYGVTFLLKFNKICFTKVLIFTNKHSVVCKYKTYLSNKYLHMSYTKTVSENHHSFTTHNSLSSEFYVEDYIVSSPAK